MKTAIRKLQAGVPTGGSTGQALVKSSGTNYDYDWANVSGSIVVTNVTIFEDFLNYSRITESGGGTDTRDDRFLYASLICDSTLNSPSFTWTTEDDHPGIVSTSDSSNQTTIRVFGIAEALSSTNDEGSIPLQNDFTLEILTRCIYNVNASAHSATYVIDSTSTDAIVIVDAASGTNNIQYTLFGVSGTTTIPASNTWFKIKWVYSAGTLSLYIDGVLIASQVGAFSTLGNGVLQMSMSESGAGSLTLGVDYVSLNYQVTR